MTRIPTEPCERETIHCLHTTLEERKTRPPWPWVYCCRCGIVYDAPPRGKHFHGGYQEIPGKGIMKEEEK